MGAVYWIPLATTVVAMTFSVIVGRRYSVKGGTHLL
jgi:hypothetical protein